RRDAQNETADDLPMIILGFVLPALLELFGHRGEGLDLGLQSRLGPPGRASSGTNSRNPIRLARPFEKASKSSPNCFGSPLRNTSASMRSHRGSPKKFPNAA